MSLESKIDQLIKAVNEQTTAINAFNGNIEEWLTTPSIVVKEENVTVTRGDANKQMDLPLEESEPEAQQAEPEQTITHKDVQDAVLAFVRKDTKKNKPLVRALLDKFEANKVGDVPESRLVEFNKELGDL
jgi:hypothetical protein